MKRLENARWWVLLLIAVLTPTALAQTLDTGDTSWLLTSTALVLFMTIPGLSLFYAGLVRQNNVLSVFMQCFSITCLVTILWLVLGYSLAFGEGSQFVGDLSKFLFNNIEEGTMSGTIPESNFATFQLTFAIITPALIVGGFAERMRFSAILIFTTLWTIIVYSPLCHWVWGGGFLSADGWLGTFTGGLMDFAGGTVVHISAGTAALVAALYLGPRRGFPTTAMIPHNLPFTVVGAGMLWVGWFGFNGGSALAANGDAAMAITVTHISAATAAFTWMVVEWIRFGKPSVLGVVTGMVAGLGSITPASGYVGPAGALVIGLLAGLVCFIATNFLKRTLKIDDSLDVFPVHGIGGILGTLLTAVFASSALGVFGGQEDINIGNQLLAQFIGVVVTVIWVGAVTWLILKVTDMMVKVRVTEDDEIEGLDLSTHNERGYNINY